MPLTPEEIEERLIALEEGLKRRLRSSRAFTTNPLALATDLDDLGSVKTHLDFEEAPLTPVDPPADVLRIYVVDVGGVTSLATRDASGLGRARKMPMNVGGTITGPANIVVFQDGVTTHEFIASVPMPSDWVAGTDISVHALLYTNSVSTGLAILRSWVAAKVAGEVFAWNIENGVNADTTIPASAELKEITRTISSADISAGEQITWLIRRSGADVSDTVNADLFLQFGPWIEYTAFF